MMLLQTGRSFSLLFLALKSHCRGLERIYLCVCVCSSSCYVSRPTVYILPAKRGHVSAVRTFWLVPYRLGNGFRLGLWRVDGVVRVMGVLRL